MPVEVADVGTARRSYTFADGSGGTTIVEIDADPSEQQLADLANNLPVLSKDRTAVFATLKEEPKEPLSTGTKAAIGVGVVAAAAAAYEIANQLGLFN